MFILDRRASKIIQNDIKLEAVLWEFDIENPFFDFCVGVWVGGQPPTHFVQSFKNFTDAFRKRGYYLLFVQEQVHFCYINRSSLAYFVSQRCGSDYFSHNGSKRWVFDPGQPF